MKHWFLGLMILGLIALHQDFWFWGDARPMVFGFLPIGLFYHACYTLAISGAMWLLVRFAWPSDLDELPTEGERGNASNEIPSRKRTQD
jgi:hypothetical protein